MLQQTGLVYDPIFLNHQTADSPECPERLLVILQKLKPDWNELHHIKPRAAISTEILRCHSKNLLDQIRNSCPRTPYEYHWLDPDTVMSEHTYEIACLAAGAALSAIDEIFAKKIRNAFCLIRPPGHHATHNQAMGFCFFNNAAIAARYAQDKYGYKNILIIDWDVHHGNGTQDIFYADPSVFYFSMHEYPFYPGTGFTNETGSGKGLGYTLNIPLPAGFPAPLYREKFSWALKEIEKKFRPDFIIISAGFDSRKDDPLADLQLTADDYYAMTCEVMEFANRSCEGRMVSLLEGGYLSETLGDVVSSHIKALAKRA